MQYKILVLSGVSGVGKTTLANLLKNRYNFKTSKSYTTRQIRSNETNEQYYFINEDDFKEKIKQNFFLEHTFLLNNYYGTAFDEIERLLNEGNVVMAICHKGYLNVKKKWPTQVIGIYLMPPTKTELKRRLQERNSPSQEIEQRISSIHTESEQNRQYFSYVLPPSTVEDTLTAVLHIFENHASS